MTTTIVVASVLIGLSLIQSTLWICGRIRRHLNRDRLSADWYRDCDRRSSRNTFVGVSWRQWPVQK